MTSRCLLIIQFLALSTFFLPTGLTGTPPQDTLVVFADNPPLWGPNPVLVEELRIGSLDGPVEESFGSVVAVAPGPDGSTLIADGLAPGVFRFSNNGAFLGQIGRSGEGPGEYRHITGFEVLPDGTMVLIDSRVGRITRTSLDETQQSISPFLGGVFTAGRSTQVGMDGTVFHLRPLFDFETPPEDWPFAWLVYPPEGQQLDTVLVPSEEREGPYFSMGGRSPFTVRTLNWMSPFGYLVWGRNDEYAINCELGDGRIRQIRRNFDQLPVLNPEWQQWVAISRYFRRPREGRRSRIPRVKPVYRYLWVDMQGRIWVDRYVTAYRHEYTPEDLEDRPKDQPLYEWRELESYDVLNPEGVFLGQVQLPENTTLLNARDNLIWAVQRGEYDEQYVIRYRIVSDPGKG